MTMFDEILSENKRYWIDCKTQKPPVGEYENISIFVLVTDGKIIGHGHYNFDCSIWTYSMPGYVEQDNNKITHWMTFPDLP